MTREEATRLIIIGVIAILATLAIEALVVYGTYQFAKGVGL